jgi:predicted  nucleic acid-binding Zn-ribbon protein
MMPQHARLASTISERLDQVELDMSAVHDAIARLSDRLDLVEQAVKDREQSHVDAISAQVDRADQMLALLRDESAAQSAVTEHPADVESSEPTSHDSGLLS